MRKFLLFVLAISLFSACVKAPPKTVGSPRPLGEAESLIQKYRGQSSLHSLSAFAEVSVEYRGRKEFFNAAVLAQGPDRLRIELINDLGETLGRLISDGKTVTWWEARDGELMEFAPGDPALQKAFRIPLSVEEFVSRLLLRFPDDEIVDYRETAGSETIGWIDRLNDRLGIDRDRFALTSYEKKKRAGKDAPLYAVAYSDWPHSSPLFPRQMLWDFFKPRFRMSLKLNEVELNQKLAPEKFNPVP